MQVSHTTRAVSASFDDPNLVSSAGLAPIMKLAARAGLATLADQRLTVPTDKGANAGLKVASLVGGMVDGADSIDDMAILRHGGMRKVFSNCYAPSTLGSFLRTFTFGHVRQLDAVASRFVRGLNAILATVKTNVSAPIIIGQRLRRGACGSPRDAARLIRDALATTKRPGGIEKARVLFRADSAFYGHASINAALTAGTDVSVTARMDPAVKRAIETIPSTAWTAIEYTNAIYDEGTKTWISNAEVAEIPFTAFTSRKKSEHITGRLVVRRIPELNKKNLDQPTLFDTHRFHAFFTISTLDTVTADKTHRAHAVIELVNSDLKSSALAHMPSGVFTANAAWLVLAVMAFNLTRAAATIAGNGLARATTATIRRKLVSIPARIALSARRITLHLPEHWPWDKPWTALFEQNFSPRKSLPT